MEEGRADLRAAVQLTLGAAAIISGGALSGHSRKPYPS
jgi:hypothetical protein